MFISVFIVALAGLRMHGNSYIETMLETFVVVFLLVYLITAFLFCWLFEAWLHLPLNIYLITQLVRSSKLQESVVNSDSVEGELRCDLMKSKERILRLYGITKFALLVNGKVSRVISRAELIKTLGRLEAGSESEKWIGNFAKNTVTYMVALRVTASALLCLLFLVVAPAISTEQPVLSLSPASSATTLPRDLVFGDPSHPRRRAVLIALCGGGTRAAVYGAAILKGLHDEGALDDNVISSGVSGGSAALAYFTMHREDLMRTGNEKSRQVFIDAMSYPYIGYVVLHAFEWRVYASQRIGELLAEAFGQRFTADHPAEITTVGESRSLGLFQYDNDRPIPSQGTM